MKFISKLIDERFAKSAARFMKFACNFVICFYVLCITLSLMGRQTFSLHTKSGTIEGAIYAEENHDTDSRNMTVDMGDDIHVWTNDSGQIDMAVQIGLSLINSVHILPMILALWFLSRVFSNIQKGQIFTEQNSFYLLYYGLLQFLAGVFAPFIKLLICLIINLVSESQMSISTGQAVFTMLIPSITFIVAAYIIHYGVGLQDGADRI